MCGGLCFFGFVCAYVYDFVLFCLRLSTAGMNVVDFLLISSITLVRENKRIDLQVRSSEALLIVYVFSVGLFAVTQVLYGDD